MPTGQYSAADLAQPGAAAPVSTGQYSLADIAPTPKTITIGARPDVSDAGILDRWAANNPQRQTLVSRQRADGRSDADIARQLLTKGGVGDPAPVDSAPDLAHPTEGAAAVYRHTSALAGAFNDKTLQNLNPVTLVKGLMSAPDSQGLGRFVPSMISSDHEQRARILDQAEQDFHDGNYGSAAIHALDGIVPVLGPIINGIGNAAESGDPVQQGQALADLVSLKAVPEAYGLAGAGAKAIPGPVGQAAGAASDFSSQAAQYAAEKGMNALNKGADALSDADLPGRAQAFFAKPSTLQNFSDSFAAVPTQKPVITQAMDTFKRMGIGPEKNVVAMSDSVGAAQQKLSGVYDTLLPFVENRLIDADSVIQGLEAEKAAYARKGVTAPANAGFVSKIDQEIATVNDLAARNGNGKLDFNDVRYLRDGMNGRTDFKSPQAEEDFYRSIGDVYRGALDRMAPETTGINRDWANLSNAKFVADKNISYGRGVTESGLNKIFRPDATKRALAAMEGIAHFGLPGAALALAPDALYHGYKFAAGLPDRFRAAADYEPPVEYPNPAADAANVRPAGLLGPASIRMGGMPDTSGTVPYRAPGSNAGLLEASPFDTTRLENTKQLPAASRIQTGGFAVGDDLVPVKDPDTGDYVYVPRWTRQEHASPVRTTPEPEGRLSKGAEPTPLNSEPGVKAGGAPAPATTGLAKQGESVPASEHDGRRGDSSGLRNAEGSGRDGVSNTGGPDQPVGPHPATAGPGAGSGVKPLSGAQIEAERLMAEAKQKAKADRGGSPYSETARRYAAPTLSNADRGESYSPNEPIGHHIGNARYERVALPVEDRKNAVALVSNLSGTEVAGRLSGHPADDAVNGILGLHFAPENLHLLIGDLKSAAGDGQSATALKPLVEAAREAQRNGKSLILVSDHELLPDALRASVLHEELNHAVQRAAAGKLDGHLGKFAAAFLNDETVAPLVERLKNAGQDVSSDGVVAAEIGEKLMRPDAAEQELGLSRPEARAVASKYVQVLRKAYGKAADPIVERINDALGLRFR